MIGTAREFQGLYYLIVPGHCSNESICQLSSVNSISSSISIQDMWNYMLGHPSY